jgi:type IV pilus assembly protein PilN
MYSLDVNFLKDRNLNTGAAGSAPSKTKSAPASTSDTIALVIGLVIMVALPGAALGWWYFATQNQAKLETDIANITQQIEQAKKIETEIAALETQVKQKESESAALASVFTQIKPWSAMLQDIRDRIPPGVQVDRIEEKQGELIKAIKSPNSKDPNTKVQVISIKGIARSFNEVNDFLLTLQRSDFLDPGLTQIESAKLIEFQVKRQEPKNDKEKKLQEELEEIFKIEDPKVVEYTIITKLNDVPATDLVRELDRKGAVGLVTRIRTLEQQGVLKR